MSYEDIMFINRKFILWVLMFGGVVDTIKSTNPTIEKILALVPTPTYSQNRSEVRVLDVGDAATLVDGNA